LAVLESEIVKRMPDKDSELRLAVREVYERVSEVDK